MMFRIAEFRDDAAADRRSKAAGWMPEAGSNGSTSMSMWDLSVSFRFSRETGPCRSESFRSRVEVAADPVELGRSRLSVLDLQLGG
jgi:hypothetical protein